MRGSEEGDFLFPIARGSSVMLLPLYAVYLGAMKPTGWILLLSRRVRLSLDAFASVVVLVEVLDEVLGDVERAFSVEDVVADLGEDELVTAILIV